MLSAIDRPAEHRKSIKFGWIIKTGNIKLEQ
jgi:hypothetical protein